MEERKIIQIISVDNTITALCNDGTIWERAIYLNGKMKRFWKWTEIKGVPSE